MTLKLRTLLLLAASALAPAAAVAADYDPPIYVEDGPEYQPVEVGSGWYIRGDVSYNLNRSYKDTSLSVDDSLFYNDLVGYGWAGPLDIFSLKEKELPVSGSVGFGYHFNDYLRGDINVGFLQDDKIRGSAHMFAANLNDGPVNWMDPAVTDIPDFGCLGSRTITTTTFDDQGDPVGQPQVQHDPDWRRDCMVNATASSSAWNGLANAYVDLGTYAGFTPYIGAGVGLIYNRTKISATATCEGYSSSETVGDTQTDTEFLCRGQSSPSDADVEYTPGSYRHSEYNLLYALNAGVSYQVSQNTSIDLGYQYMNAPGVEHYSIGEDGIERHKGIDYHQVKLGLRYDLW